MAFAAGAEVRGEECSPAARMAKGERMPAPRVMRVVCFATVRRAAVDMVVVVRDGRRCDGWASWN